MALRNGKKLNGKNIGNQLEGSSDMSHVHTSDSTSHFDCNCLTHCTCRDAEAFANHADCRSRRVIRGKLVNESGLTIRQTVQNPFAHLKTLKNVQKTSAKGEKTVSENVEHVPFDAAGKRLSINVCDTNKALR